MFRKLLTALHTPVAVSDWAARPLAEALPERVADAVTEAVVAGVAESVAAAHPHRRPLRWERPRRPGVAPARPILCISPVRGALDPGEFRWSEAAVAGGAEAGTAAGLDVRRLTQGGGG